MANSAVLDEPVMRKLDSTGDTAIKWNPHNEDEVDVARRTFEELTAKGFTAFRADDKGAKTGTPIKTFDPSVKQMVMVPKVEGGYPTGAAEYA